MTREEKQLLLRDLCARLPYGVKIELTWWVMGEGTCMNTTLELDHIEQLLNDEYGDAEIKLYLRSMSSMTDEERYEIQEILGKDIEIFDDSINIIDSSRKRFSFLELQALLNWLNAHHFDYCVEYTRTDVFIEKACDWLESVNLDFYQIREGVFSRQLVEDFKKYMEE